LGFLSGRGVEGLGLLPARPGKLIAVFDHVTIRAADRGASERFYETVLRTLAIEKTHAGEDFAKWGDFSLASAAAPSGVERTVLIGAGLGATQVIDILAADESKMAVAIVADDQGRWADQVAGVPVVGGTDELKEHKAENRFDSVVIAISTSVLLERGSASCAESPVRGAAG
jgi:FlaA1/EpsC-like NDP-sugar epimerase